MKNEYELGRLEDMIRRLGSRVDSLMNRVGQVQTKVYLLEKRLPKPKQPKEFLKCAKCGNFVGKGYGACSCSPTPNWVTE